MSKVPTAFNRRVLIIDDTQSIHDDFDKILLPPVESAELQNFNHLDDLIFNEASENQEEEPPETNIEFEVDHAHQGQDGLEKVRKSVEERLPYALAFIDMRMPPGWDGLQTIEEIWKADPNIQIVICSAYSDYTWEEIILRLGQSDHLLILKKPFDQAEVYQMAAALTEKWNIKQRSDSLMENLENKVEERTIELNEVNQRLQRLNGDLESAVKEAECAARAKGRFLATMSHEIRTTLNGIMGASYMLANSELNEYERDFAKIIQQSGESLMTIINDILDYSKYESGELELESIPFPPNQLAEECVNLLKPIIDKNEVQFALAYSERIPNILIGDPGRIRQILLNLLNNALKFSKGRTVELAVDLKRIEEENAWIEFAVTDTGIGMSKDTQSRLFNSFMQADSSTTREFGGTGLGLAICRLLADAMQAEIKVESELGKGSTFRVSLPLLIESRKADAPESSPQSAKAAAVPNLANAEKDSHPFEGKRALLVDDNPINAKLARHFLKKLKIEPEIATNGAEAVKQYEKNEYDFILMDLQMPVLDGYGASLKIREIESQREVDQRLPIIALTANAFPENRERCFESGMDDFLTKPLRIQDLKAILGNWLKPVKN
ncbi:MAG: response regulator [Verrucomicrobiota bacterium]